MHDEAWADGCQGLRMRGSGVIDDLFIGLIIGLTLGLCFFIGFSGHESTSRSIDLPVHNSRTAHHQAETQISWWLRLKHKKLLYWNKSKTQQEQIARDAARIIAGLPVNNDLVEPETSKETQLAYGDCGASAADEKHSDTPKPRPKRPRAPSFDDKEHERERDIFLVRNGTGDIGLSAPPKKKYKKAKHPRARRAMLWFSA